MIVSARVLSNGGVLAGNKLMSGCTGSARCYVRPPLTAEKILFFWLCTRAYLCEGKGRGRDKWRKGDHKDIYQQTLYRHVVLIQNEYDSSSELEFILNSILVLKLGIYSPIL